MTETILALIPKTLIVNVPGAANPPVIHASKNGGAFSPIAGTASIIYGTSVVQINLSAQDLDTVGSLVLVEDDAQVYIGTYLVTNMLEGDVMGPNAQAHYSSLTILQPDLIGLAATTGRNPVLVTSSSLLTLSWLRENQVPSIQAEVDLTAVDIRSGYTFTPKLLADGLRSSDPIAILGSTTDGETTEDAIYLHFNDANPQLNIMVSGDWGLFSGDYPAGTFFRTFATNDTETDGFCVIKQIDLTTIRIVRWQYDGTFTDSRIIANLPAGNWTYNVFLAGSDAEGIYIKLANTSGEKLLVKIRKSDATVIATANLSEVMVEYLGGVNCTSIHATDGLVYVMIDDDIQVVAVYDTTLQLIHSSPILPGTPTMVAQGFVDTPYSVCGYAGYGNIIFFDRNSGLIQRSIHVPMSDSLLLAVNGSGEFPVAVYGGEKGIFFLSCTGDGDVFLSRLNAEVVSQQAAITSYRRVTTLGSPLQVSDSRLPATAIAAKSDVDKINGSGNTAVDHNTGGTDNLRFVDNSGNGIDNAEIKVYLKTDYDAGNRGSAYVKARSGTQTDGRWPYPVYLDTGQTYTFVFFKQGEFSVSTKEVAI